MKPEYQKLVVSSLSCLSVASFLQLAQLLVPVASPFILGFLALYAPVSILMGANSFYRERGRERFDLSAPTAFESGVLVLRSKGDKCAAFFAFAFQPRDISNERLRRTLTTLLKVLPNSSVLSIEMARPNEYYTSLYVKLEKADILQGIQKLVESILSNLRAFFGDNSVRLLRDDELLRHLTLGIPGRIQRVCRSNRHMTLLQTDEAKCWLRAVSMASIQRDSLQALEKPSDQNGESYRVIFSTKSEDRRRVVLGSKLVVITSRNRPHSEMALLASNPIAMRRMRASEIARQLGDIMTRNVLAESGNCASFEKAADELVSFLTLGRGVRSDAESAHTQHMTTHQISADTPKWRDILSVQAEQLRCALETNALVWVKGFPLRVDAKAGQTLFKVVPSCSGDAARLRWLIDMIAYLTETEPASDAVLLLDSPSDVAAINQALAKASASRRIRLITSGVQLLELLQESRAPTRPLVESPARTAQKIL